MPQYVPSEITAQTVEELRQQIMFELRQLSSFAQMLDEGRNEVLHVEPDKPQEAQLVYADGTDWDPGEGAGYYQYTSSVWVKLSGSADVAAHVASADPHTQYQKESEKDAANGYAGLSAGSKLSGLQVPYGAAANTACEGNDGRLSDSRTPDGPAGGDLEGTYPDPTVAITVRAQPYAPGDLTIPTGYGLVMAGPLSLGVGEVLTLEGTARIVIL